MNSSEISPIEIEFVNSEDIRINDLADFLRDFKTFYVVTQSEEFDFDLDINQFDTTDRVRDLEEVRNETIDRLEWKLETITELESRYETDLGTSDLYIETIRKESPLTITFIGISSIILLGALVISGGELEVDTKLVKVNTLASGLKELKKVFRKKDLVS